jgi:hypothetical protein
MSRFVGLLDDARSERHNVQKTGDGSYHGTVAAAKIRQPKPSPE